MPRIDLQSIADEARGEPYELPVGDDETITLDRLEDWPVDAMDAAAEGRFGAAFRIALDSDVKFGKLDRALGGMTLTKAQRLFETLAEGQGVPSGNSSASGRSSRNTRTR